MEIKKEVETKSRYTLKQGKMRLVSDFPGHFRVSIWCVPEDLGDERGDWTPHYDEDWEELANLQDFKDAGQLAGALMEIREKEDQQ